MCYPWFVTILLFIFMHSLPLVIESKSWRQKDNRASQLTESSVCFHWYLPDYIFGNVDNNAVKWATGKSTELKPGTQTIKKIGLRCCVPKFIRVETHSMNDLSWLKVNVVSSVTPWNITYYFQYYNRSIL